MSLLRTPEQPWYSRSAEDIAAEFGVDTASGLHDVQVEARQQIYAPNRLQVQKRSPIWKEFLEELGEPMILLLLVTGVLYSIWGRLSDAITIFVIILVLVGVEVFNEYRAKRAIASLSKLAEPTAAVRRNGQYCDIPVEEIVPGDLLLLQAGRRVAADARLLDAYSLEIDEAPLTGESLPVDKSASVFLPENTALAEQRNLVFAGTVALRGRGSAIVVATGMQTALGKIAGLAQSVKPPRTSLQQAMRELTGWLIWLALGFSVIVPLLGFFLSKQPLQQMLLTGLSLAFATIPEELPIIITMVLALGAYRLSKEHAIVKRLQAVETLGAVTTIATDKTGTLTEKRMQVGQVFPVEQRRKLIELGVLCNAALANGEKFVGDPLDVALLDDARTLGIDSEALRHQYPLQDEFTFDTLRKRMAVVYRRADHLWVIVKGAPEAILAQCNQQQLDGQVQALTLTERDALLETATRMAGEGLRVLALAEKTVAEKRLSQDEAEHDLIFVGFIGFLDPPRPTANAALADCKAAGIRTIMITGDHPLTARTIAQKVGLQADTRVVTGPELDTLTDGALQEIVGSVSIYARTTPTHKLRIVRALHACGERVAVTGDGINDAPALVAADIGIAMGETGTDVAREAADVVLADDNFATIVKAVAEGRVLFANLRKGVRYYLACKVALVSATLLPVLLGVPVPFAPVQIILMELFMDLAAAATFVSEPAEPGLMRHPPRNPLARFMDRSMVGHIFSAAAGLFAAVAFSYLVTWYTTGDLTNAQTVAFVSWLLGHVFLAFNLRSEQEPLSRLGFFSNRLMLIWAAVTLLFVLCITFVPLVQNLLKTGPLQPGQWLLIVCTTLFGTFWIELRKLLRVLH